MQATRDQTGHRALLDRLSQNSSAKGILRKLGERPLPLIAVVFFLSSLVTGPLDPKTAADSFHWRVGPIYVGRPVSFWGDTPHYLLIVNSIIEDGDFDVANNYAQAEQGDWDQGTRFKGKPIDHHVDRDTVGQELSYHAPFLPLLLAAFCWPFRETQWVESVCIWLTLAVSIISLGFLSKRFSKGNSIVLLLAFATPLWCYSRDVWTEPWIMAAWILMLTFSNPWVQAVAAIAGILFKYSFAVVPATFALVAIYRKDWRRALIIGGASVVAVLFAFGFIQLLFRHTDHFSLFHLGAHGLPGQRERFGPFTLRSAGLIGLLLSPKDGILPFSPFLAWGFWNFRRGGAVFLPALSFFALHGFYYGWKAGSGFSARYLVPMLPVMVYGAVLSGRRPRSLFWVFVIYSAVVCGIAGLLPSAAYDRSVPEIFGFLWSEIQLP